MVLGPRIADTFRVKLVKLVGAWLVLALAAGGVAAATTHGPDSTHLKPPAVAFHGGSVPQMTSPAVPTEASDPSDASHDSHGGSTGLHGLDNAIAHVKANLAKHPNKGLQNAIQRLMDNLAKHEAKKAAHAAKKTAHQSQKAAHSSGPTTHS